MRKNSFRKNAAILLVLLMSLVSIPSAVFASDTHSASPEVSSENVRSIGNLLHESNGVQVYKNYLSAVTGGFYDLCPALYYTATPICWPYKCHPLSDSSTWIGGGRVSLAAAVPEMYFVDGETAYGFDRGTPATAGTYMPSSSVSEAGIPTTEAKALNAAKVAKILTDNDYAVLRAGVDTYVRSSAILTNVNFQANGQDVSPNVWKGYIRDNDDLCYALVQMIVWNVMNDGTWLAYDSSVGGYDSQNPYHTYPSVESGAWIDPKTGETHNGGTFPATVSIGAFIDLESAYEYALDYLDAHTAQSDYDEKWEQTIMAGETIELTGDEGIAVWEIYEQYGYYGNAEQITVSRSGGVTYVTAAANAATAMYGWQETALINTAIRSGKPYQEGVEGQFIMKETAIQRVCSRITVETAGLILGDVNRDGVVNSTDALILMRHILGAPITGIVDIGTADVNHDGAISSGDVLLILRYAIGVIDHF